MPNEQRELAVQELDKYKVVRDPAGAILIALVLLVIPLFLLYVIFKR